MHSLNECVTIYNRNRMKRTILLLCLAFIFAGSSSFAQITSLNGLDITSTISIESVFKVLGEPENVMLLISSAEEGDIFHGVIDERVFDRTGYEEMLKLAKPENKNYYSVKFVYGNNWVEIATPDITAMTENGSIPVDMDFGDEYELDNFFIDEDSDWVLGNGKNGVSTGDPVGKLKEIVPAENITEGKDGSYFFSPDRSDDTWQANCIEGKIVSLFYQAASWI